jgi:hypothetical protein
MREAKTERGTVMLKKEWMYAVDTKYGIYVFDNIDSIRAFEKKTDVISSEIITNVFTSCDEAYMDYHYRKEMVDSYANYKPEEHAEEYRY